MSSSHGNQLKCFSFVNIKINAILYIKKKTTSFVKNQQTVNTNQKKNSSLFEKQLFLNLNNFF